MILHDRKRKIALLVSCGTITGYPN